jgi:hypothetical protein
MVPSFDIPGRNIVIASGTCIIKGQVWWCDANVATGIPGASAQDRIDVLVIRLNRLANSSSTVVQPVVIQGAPSGSPVAPPIQQTSTGLWDIPVCQWTSHANGALDGLVDKRQFSGHSVVAMISTFRPSPPHPRIGLETDTGYLMRWDGTIWRNIGPKNQVLSAGATCNTTTVTNLHTPFPIPGNDAQLGAVSYRIRAGGIGKQATGTPRAITWQTGSFNIYWGVVSDTGAIPAGANFNWHYSGELIVNPNGSASFYGEVTMSEAVSSPGNYSSAQAMAKQVAAGTINIVGTSAITLQAFWTSVTGGPTLTCYGATYDRVAN